MELIRSGVRKLNDNWSEFWAVYKPPVDMDSLETEWAPHRPREQGDEERDWPIIRSSRSRILVRQIRGVYSEPEVTVHWNAKGNKPSKELKAADMGFNYELFSRYRYHEEDVEEKAYSDGDYTTPIGLRRPDWSIHRG